MKQKILMLLAAVLLSSVNAFAQSGDSESLKGDVNGDGIVDVADIAAIIDIMANGGGTVEETAFYYYAGWTLPTVDNVDEIINETYPTSSTDTTPHAAGKKTTSKSSFSLASINLYNSTAKTNYYVLVPKGQAIYDTVFGLPMGTDSFTSQGTITVGNQTHTIYKSVDTTRNIGSIEIDDEVVETAYYWYVGTTAVNPSNYKTVASQVTTIPESTTISLNEQQLFIVAPSNKTVTALTSDGDGINLNTYDTSTGTFTRTATTLGDGYTLYASRGTSITDSAAVINVR